MSNELRMVVSCPSDGPGVVGRFCFACSYNVLLRVVVNYSTRCLVRHTAAAAFQDDECRVGAYKVRRPRHPVWSLAGSAEVNRWPATDCEPAAAHQPRGALVVRRGRRRWACDVRPSRQPWGASRSTFEGAVWSGRPWEASSARQGRSYRRVLPSGQGRVRPADPRPRADPRVGEPGRDARRRRAGAGAGPRGPNRFGTAHRARRLPAAIPGRSPTSRKATSSSTVRGPRSTARLARMPLARGAADLASTRSRGPRTRSSRSRQGRRVLSGPRPSGRALSGPCLSGPRPARCARRGPWPTR